MYSNAFGPRSAHTLFHAISAYSGPDRRHFPRRPGEAGRHTPLWIVLPVGAAISVAGWLLAIYLAGCIARLLAHL